MKFCLEYEFVYSSLLNHSPIPSLDIFFEELLCEERRLSTQFTLERSRGSYEAQCRGPPVPSNNLQCFCSKDFGQVAANCLKK